MTTKSRQKQLIATWLTVTCVLATGAIIAYRQVTQISEQSHWVSHTHTNISCLDDIQTDCLQVENSNRAYALTGETDYLTQRNDAKKSALKKINEFADFTVDNLKQQAVIPELRKNVNDRFAWADKTLPVLRKRFSTESITSEDARKMILHGTSLTTSLQKCISAMKAEEERLLVVRLGHQSEETNRTRLVLIALSLFAMLCLLAAIWMIWVYVRESREAEMRFKAIFDNTFQFTGMIATDGRILDANKTALEFSRSKIEDIRGLNIWDLAWWWDPATKGREERAHIRQAFDDAVAGKFVQLETTLWGLNGRKITIDMSLKPIFDYDGKVIFIISEGRDISARVAIENLVKTNETKLKSLLAGLAEGIYQTDREGNLVFLNAAAEKIIGYREEEILGQNMHHLIHATTPEGQFRPVEECELLSVIKQLEVVRTPEDWFQRRDGTYVPVEYVSSPVFENEQCVGAVIAFQDITQRLEAENRVSEFYSTVSHELRTPLTSIRGALRLLEGGKGGALEPKAAKLVKMGRTECDRLVRLINDMLDIRKIEAGKLELKLVELKTSTPVAEALENLAPYAAENHVRLKSEILEDFSFFADKDRLTQIMTNLISNAIKFSPNDGEVLIKVAAAAVTSGADRKAVRFSVIDKGCGISELAQQKLFGLFQQVDSSDSRAQGGTGLGLAISKALVEQHGGKIGINSKVGEGSTFWFEMPLPSSNKNALIEKIDTEVYTPSKPLLMLVEDDIALSTLLSFSLQDTYEVRHAGSLKAAYEILKTQKPSAILLDLHLPDGHGIDLVDSMKEAAETKDIPVVLMSGSEGKFRNVVQPVVIDFLKKPFDENHLRDALMRAQKYHPEKTAHVLVAEDDESTLTLLRDQIERLGHKCTAARTSEETLEAIQLGNIDLLVLDLTLPGVGGEEIIQLLKREGNDIPLIVYTAKDLSSSEKAALSLKITKHLTKSIASEDDFIGAVKDILDGLLTPTKK